MTGDRIELARCARGMSQRDLAAEVGLSAMAISKMERGGLIPSREVLEKIAVATKLPYGFFHRPAIGRPPSLFRKRAAMPRRLLQQTEALATVYLDAVEAALDAAGVRFEFRLPALRTSPEQTAVIARRLLQLGNEPVAHVTAVLEQAGVTILQIISLSHHFDAFSTWHREMPVIVADRGVEDQGDRQRFTLAHELGHLLLHRGAPPDFTAAESEADEFASAFLLPEAAVSEIAAVPFTPVALASVKLKWRVSFQCIAMRAWRTGIVSHADKKRFFVSLSDRGWRKREPVAIPLERPQVLRKTLQLLRQKGRLDAASFVVPFAEIATLAGVQVA